jgi:pilus assembly protein CpaB
MRNKRRILGIFTACLLAGIGTLALVGYVRSATQDAVAQEALVEVYVVTELVPKGAEAEFITSSVTLTEVPARLKQQGAVTDLAEVGANVAATDLQPGDQLLAARLVPQMQVSTDVTDKVQVAVQLTAERAVGGSLAKGDLVGVYLSFDPFESDASGRAAEVERDSEPSDAVSALASSPTDATAGRENHARTPHATRLEFQHVLITNVQTTSPPVAPGANDEVGIEQVTGSHYVVTLALSPEESERFVFASEFGRVWLSKDPATVSDDGTRLVTVGNVYAVVS